MTSNLCTTTSAVASNVLHERIEHSARSSAASGWERTPYGAVRRAAFVSTDLPFAPSRRRTERFWQSQSGGRPCFGLSAGVGTRRRRIGHGRLHPDVLLKRTFGSAAATAPQRGMRDNTAALHFIADLILHRPVMMPGGGYIARWRKRLQTRLMFRFQRSGSVSLDNDTAPTDAFGRWAVRGP